MTNIIVVLAIIGGFLFWERNKSIIPSTLSETSQYLRLLLLPLGQLAICGIIIFFAYMGEDVLLSKSPFVEDTIRQNLGLLSGVATDMFNEYRSDKLSPYIAEIGKYHKWAGYLFYGLIVSFAFQIYALKSKVCSKELIIGICTFASVTLLFVAFKVLYACDMGAEAMVSTETFGLLGASSGYAMQSTISLITVYLLILFFLHYFHNRWINQYYLEQSELDIEEVKDNVMKNKDNSDEDNFDNLRKLKELLDAGILTPEEHAEQKRSMVLPYPQQEEQVENNKIDMLRNLKTLLDSEILSKEEYNTQKSNILRIASTPMWKEGKSSVDILIEMKALLDENILTQEEFDFHKKIILNAN